jgi:hypothetical protein
VLLDNILKAVVLPVVITQLTDTMQVPIFESCNILSNMYSDVGLLH